MQEGRACAKSGRDMIEARRMMEAHSWMSAPEIPWEARRGTGRPPWSPCEARTPPHHSTLRKPSTK
eukprot:385094-Rhodomonas_salina.1